jgi:GDPmannose 4,6-dehydratase
MPGAKVLVIGANSQDACVLAEIMANSDEELVLTSLAKSNSKSIHNKFFPTNKVIKTVEYNVDFFLKLMTNYNFKKIYIFASISTVNDETVSERDYLDSTIGLVKSFTEALFKSKVIESVMVFHSSSVEMFGKKLFTQQTELTDLNPQSPYAKGKALAHLHFQELRAKGICKSINGIMYNHESKYRKEDFVTQKICKSVAEIYLNKRNLISLGDLKIFRDWSYANDLIAAVKFGMDNELIGDYILASGTAHSLEDWISSAFGSVDILNWADYIEIDQSLLRTADEYLPDANISKAKKVLHLQQTVSFDSLVRSMVDFNLEQQSSNNE